MAEIHSDVAVKEAGEEILDYDVKKEVEESEDITDLEMEEFRKE